MSVLSRAWLLGMTERLNGRTDEDRHLSRDMRQASNWAGDVPKWRDRQERIWSYGMHAALLKEIPW